MSAYISGYPLCRIVTFTAPQHLPLDFIYYSLYSQYIDFLATDFLP